MIDDPDEDTAAGPLAQGRSAIVPTSTRRTCHGPKRGKSETGGHGHRSWQFQPDRLQGKTRSDRRGGVEGRLLCRHMPRLDPPSLAQSAGSRFDLPDLFRPEECDWRAESRANTPSYGHRLLWADIQLRRDHEED